MNDRRRQEEPAVEDSKEQAGSANAFIAKFRLGAEASKLVRFIGFGLFAALLDLLTLNALLALGFSPSWAKLIGYLVALSFTLTFVSPFVFRRIHSLSRLLKTSVVYISTGAINVWTFSIILDVTASINWAFLIGTATSASLNFIALRVINNSAAEK
jgi:putative flippase GtrA